MTRLLPDSGLATVAHSVELNALSESLDGAMAVALARKADAIDEAAYGGPIARSGGRTSGRARSTSSSGSARRSTS